MITYTVYALLCPDTKNVRYIGYTKGALKRRLTDHYADANIKAKMHTHKARWLKSLKKRALILPIEEGITDINYALRREVFWITQYSNLTNSTTGGEIAKEFTAEVKKKISQTKKRKYALGETVNFFKGKKNPLSAKMCKEAVWTPERRKKISDARKKYVATDFDQSKARAVQKCRPVKMLSLSGELVRIWDSVRHAHAAGYDRGAVSRCCKGKHKFHKGFKWAYYETDI